MLMRVVRNNKQQEIIVHSETNDELWCLCPFHEDKGRPNLMISKTGSYAGFYKCFACGKFGTAKSLGFDIHSHKYQKEHKQPMSINWTALSQSYESCAITEYRYHYLMNEWDVSKNVLEILNLGWDSEAFTWPMRNEFFEVTGIQRRFMNRKKRSVKGSQLGCIIPDTIDFSDVILVCEGVSDTATVLDLGFEAIGRPGACTCYEIAASILTGCPSIIVADDDDAGRKGAYKLATKLTQVSKCGIIYPEEGKDISDFVSKKGKDYVKTWLKKKVYKMRTTINL